MKTDIERMKEFSDEMKVNDMVFKKIQLDSFMLQDEIATSSWKYSVIDLDEMFEKYHFSKRLLELFDNNDLPLKAAIGLVCSHEIVDELYRDKEIFIGDSNSDDDIFEYVIEKGYRMYDSLREKSFEDLSDEVKSAIENFYYVFGTGDIGGGDLDD